MKSVAEEIRELANKLQQIDEGGDKCPCCNTTVNECSCSSSCKGCDCKKVNEAEDEYDDDGDVDTTGMNLGNVGSELDQDDDDEVQGFKGAPMFDQLGKILDSQGNPKPVNTVTTDDGKTFKVAPEQARMLRMLATTDKVKPIVRDKFTKDIQTSNGLSDFVDIKDPKEIPGLFVRRYLG